MTWTQDTAIRKERQGHEYKIVVYVNKKRKGTCIVLYKCNVSKIAYWSGKKRILKYLWLVLSIELKNKVYIFEQTIEKVSNVYKKCPKKYWWLVQVLVCPMHICLQGRRTHITNWGAHSHPTIHVSSCRRLVGIFQNKWKSGTVVTCSRMQVVLLNVSY